MESRKSLSGKPSTERCETVVFDFDGMATKPNVKVGFLGHPGFKLKGGLKPKKTLKGALPDKHLDKFLLNKGRTTSQWSRLPQKGTSKYKCTQKRKCYRNGKAYIYWTVDMRYKGRVVLTKSFPFSPEGELIAAKWYDKMAIELYGDLAYTNAMHFPEDFK